MWEFFREFRRAAGPASIHGVLLAALLVTAGCAVRRTRVTPPSQRPAPALKASASDLLKELDGWSSNVHTLQAEVDFEPTAGSVYSGVISQYPHVRGFVLLKAPATIRILGQAPVVRTKIFDMVSNGREFRLYIPPKNKFIIGNTAVEKQAKNSLENMRPQHILDALLVRPLDSAKDRYFLAQAQSQDRSYYVLGVLDAGQGRQMNLQREFWFDRSDLKLARWDAFGAEGRLLEEVEYSDYRNFGEVSYPGEIQVRRPAEDYALGIKIEKATFNLTLGPEKFVLPQPPGAEVVHIDGGKTAEAPDGR